MLSFKQFLVESGKAVSGVVPINQENALATVKDIENQVIKKLGLNPKNDMSLLGSTGKKKTGESSGDIDIAISTPKLFLLKDVKSGQDVFIKIKKLVKSVAPSISFSKGLNIVSFAFPINNVNGQQSNQFVQADIMLVDDIKFSAWAFWSPTAEESKWKGLYRNILLMSVIAETNIKTVKIEGDVVVEFEKFALNLNKGLMRNLKSVKGKRGLLKNPRTLKSEFTSNNIGEIINIVLGPMATIQDTNSFESIYKYITSSKFPHKKERNKIFKSAVRRLVKKSVMVPSELEAYI